MQSKKQWFIRIGGLNETEFLWPLPDDFNLTPTGLDDTVFGQMLPFSFAGYYDPQNTTATGPSTQYALDPNSGAPPVQLFSTPYSFFFNNSSQPFQEVFHSSGLDSPSQCATNVSCFSTVLIYKVNPNP